MRPLVQEETIRGEVASVKLLKDGWGRATLRAGSDDSASTTVMGTVLGIDTGTTVECKGRWDTHPTYGKQFKASSIVTIVPSDASGAIAWLSTKLPKLGRKRATEIVSRYGIPALWDILDEDCERLAEVPGITLEGSRAIGEEYRRVKSDRAEMVTLRGWGLTESQITKAREKWGKDVILNLQQDPFALCREVHGFGFARADEVARKMGTPTTHPGRIRACLMHMLSEAEGQGHVYVPQGALVRMSAEALGLSGSVVADQVDVLEQEKRIAREGTKLFRAELFQAEVSVAECASMMLRSAA